VHPAIAAANIRTRPHVGSNAQQQMMQRNWESNLNHVPLLLVSLSFRLALCDILPQAFHFL
jgi:hypothetical protein